MLLISSCRDEELVLDVQEVLAVLDDSCVGILNRMLQRASIAPFGAAAHDLARHVATVLRGGTTIGGESILIRVDLTS